MHFPIYFQHRREKSHTHLQNVVARSGVKRKQYLVFFQKYLKINIFLNFLIRIPYYLDCFPWCDAPSPNIVFWY